MKNRILFLGMLLMAAFILSSCNSMDAQFRAEMCPNCTDAEWTKINNFRSGKPNDQNDPKVKACIASCSQKQPICSAKVSQLLSQKAPTGKVSEQLSICANEERQCTNGCMGIVEPVKKKKPANAVIYSASSDVDLIDPTDKAPVRREIFPSDSPFWRCLNPNYFISTGCTSDANTAGKKFVLTAHFESFDPPSKGFSFSDIAKILIPGCGMQIKTSWIGSAAPNPGIMVANLGLKACGSIQKMRANKDSNFRGTMHLGIDGTEVYFCDYFGKKGAAASAGPCFQKYFTDETKRKALFDYTGTRPANKYGAADAVHILHSCANRNNWASTGRDATSEEVAFCETRKTLQNGKSYFIEARQLNLGGGNETIKITIGQSKSTALHPVENTRIKRVHLVYHCGNKSFDRMRKKPRDTAAACIEDMIGLAEAKRGGQSEDLQYDAASIDALGGYGRTQAEELDVLKCREVTIMDEKMRKCRRLWDR